MRGVKALSRASISISQPTSVVDRDCVVRIWPGSSISCANGCLFQRSPVWIQRQRRQLDRGGGGNNLCGSCCWCCTCHYCTSGLNLSLLSNQSSRCPFYSRSRRTERRKIDGAVPHSRPRTGIVVIWVTACTVDIFRPTGCCQKGCSLLKQTKGPHAE